jgi:hypothetical protein
VLAVMSEDLYETYKDVDVFSLDKKGTLLNRKIFLVVDKKLGRTGYNFEVIGDETKIPKTASLM